MIYFTADTHFNHPLMARLRKFTSVGAMNVFIIKIWNKTIKSKDIVYHLGDFCFGGHDIVKKFRYQLNGQIHLIIGNHDFSNRIQNIDGLFTSLSDIKIIKYNHQKIVLCHYAMRVWPSSHYNTWQLYAHSHSKLPPIGKQWDVGLDNNNFKILSIDNIIDIMEKRPDNLNLIRKKEED